MGGLRSVQDAVGLAVLHTGTTETVWLEDFNLPDGTKVDTGDTAWTSGAEGRACPGGQRQLVVHTNSNRSLRRSLLFTLIREVLNGAPRPGN